MRPKSISQPPGRAFVGHAFLPELAYWLWSFRRNDSALVRIETTGLAWTVVGVAHHLMELYQRYRRIWLVRRGGGRHCWYVAFGGA